MAIAGDGAQSPERLHPCANLTLVYNLKVRVVIPQDPPTGVQIREDHKKAVYVVLFNDRSGELGADPAFALFADGQDINGVRNHGMVV